MKILVRFAGDNDFGSVMRAFGNLLVSDQWNPEVLTKENLSAWFNQISKVLYIMVQNRGNYRDRNQSWEESVKTTGEYLQIEPKDVYVGAEAEAKMADWNSWGNQDSVLVDLDTGDVSVV